MLELKARDFASFFAAPFAAYGAQSLYVSPMKADLARFLSTQNPLFASAEDFTYWTALRNGQPVGRITAHLHRASNALHAEARGCFGFFDCADDQDAADALLKAAEDWTRAKGCDQLLGNFNLTAMQQAGVMTEGFEHPPYTDQIWSPPHLHKLLEVAGFQRQFPMTTFEMRLDRHLDRHVTALPEAQRQALLQEGFHFATVSRATISQRMEEARLILNRAFQDNPMFVPVSAEEFHFQAKDMKWIMDPRVSKVVHHQGAPAGAVIAIPDLNPLLKRLGSRFRLSLPWHYLRHMRTRRRAVIIFQGVMPEFQARGVNPLILSEVLGAMRQAGYDSVGGTWIADENPASLRQVEKTGAAKLHRLHLFGKAL